MQIKHAKARLDVHVRWMIAHDVPACIAIHNATFRTQWTEDALKESIKSHTSIFGLIAERGPKVVGAIVVEIRHKSYHVVTLSVDKDRRAYGIGAQLIDKLKAKLSGKRTKLSADVPESNLGALLFFQAQGFIASGVRRAQFDGEDGIRMKFWPIQE
jgi:ribosomal protein S18 acetylase RimI-like enzyme